MRKFKLFVLSLLVCEVLIASLIVYGILLSWSSSVTVKVASPSIGVYWDAECKRPVTSIDLGTLQQGTIDWQITLYIKNNAKGGVKLWWNSTINQASSEMRDAWEYYYEYGWYEWYDLNGVIINAGQVLKTRYRIWITTYCPIGNYNWTLNLGVMD